MKTFVTEDFIKEKKTCEEFNFTKLMEDINKYGVNGKVVPITLKAYIKSTGEYLDLGVYEKIYLDSDAKLIFSTETTYFDSTKNTIFSISPGSSNLDKYVIEITNKETLNLADYVTYEYDSSINTDTLKLGEYVRAKLQNKPTGKTFVGTGIVKEIDASSLVITLFSSGDYDDFVLWSWELKDWDVEITVLQEPEYLEQLPCEGGFS